jgi:hypothetical protein
MGVSPKVEEDEDWEETLNMREEGDLARSGRRKSSSSGESKGGYKSRHKNVTRRLRKSRR